MKIYVKGKGIIAPSNITDEMANNESVEKVNCIEPDYTDFFDNRILRRMSRIVKLGSTAAAIALKEANIGIPGAIVVGTGFGCLEDTGLFLRKMIINNEKMLNPTPFIFSTHNTIASQIAILLKAYGYNSTYSHRKFSFEFALFDAYLLLKENYTENALVGGIDELTEDSFTLLKELGYYKENTAGEGASFFLLTNKEEENCYVEVKAVQMYSNTSIEEVKIKSGTLFKEYQIDRLVIGSRKDKINKNDLDVIELVNADCKIIYYKHLSGEYPTANAFAFGMAVEIFKNKEVKNLLIYNHYSENNHSFILLSAC